MHAFFPTTSTPLSCSVVQHQTQQLIALLSAGEADGDNGAAEGEEGASQRRRRRTHELNPAATLEPSLEALNVKKFDLAFTVDPLFHKTSAQFDEGGAKGG
jgi:condensin complex subunit 2